MGVWFIWKTDNKSISRKKNLEGEKKDDAKVEI